VDIEHTMPQAHPGPSFYDRNRKRDDAVQREHPLFTPSVSLSNPVLYFLKVKRDPDQSFIHKIYRYF
jgi:hypothetical protein